MKYITCLIVVENIDKSVKFYKEVLKQTVLADFGENVSFKGGFSLHQKSHFKSLIQGREVASGSNSCELYFEHSDLITFSNRLKELDIEFIHDVVEQPWRQRVLRFYDYDKNIVEVGEGLDHTAFRLFQEGLKLEDISKITYMDIDSVKKAIVDYGGAFAKND